MNNQPRSLEESVRMINRAKSIADFITKYVGPTLLVGVLGLGCWFGYRVNENYKSVNGYITNIQQNLAPNSLDIKLYWNPIFGIKGTNFECMGAPEDVNGDGTFESVLKFVNPINGKVELRLIERYGETIKIRNFKVMDGKIEYIQE